MKSHKYLIPVYVLSLGACHQMNIAQWTSVPEPNLREARLVDAVRQVGATFGLSDSTNPKKFPNTIVLMSEQPVRSQSVDLGLRYKNRSYVIDVWAGYGPKNEKFEVIKSGVESMLKSQFPEQFTPTSDPISP